jgi:hypothetical protein
MLVQPLAFVVVGWLGTNVIKKPKDHERAATIEVIARAAAAQLVAEFPDKPWATLIEEIIAAIGDQIPTTNRVVARRAAAEALVDTQFKVATIKANGGTTAPKK